MKSWTVVAYTYNADIYCPGCVRTMAAHALAAPGEAAFMGRPSDGDTAEEFLARWAASVGIDATDERSYDSDEFPKVVFVDMLDGSEHCGACGGEL